MQIARLAVQNARAEPASGLERRAVVHDNEIDPVDCLHQAIQNGSAEPTAIQRLPRSAKDHMGNPIFLDEGGDGADEIDTFEGERCSAQLPGGIEGVAHLALGRGIDVFRRFARLVPWKGRLTRSLLRVPCPRDARLPNMAQTDEPAQPAQSNTQLTGRYSD